MQSFIWNNASENIGTYANVKRKSVFTAVIILAAISSCSSSGSTDTQRVTKKSRPEENVHKAPLSLQ